MTEGVARRPPSRGEFLPPEMFRTPKIFDKEGVTNIPKEIEQPEIPLDIEVELASVKRSLREQTAAVEGFYASWTDRLKEWSTGDAEKLRGRREEIREFLRAMEDVPFLRSHDSYGATILPTRRLMPEVWHDTNNPAAALFALKEILDEDLVGEDMPLIQEELLEIDLGIAQMISVLKDSQLRHTELETIPFTYPREALNIDLLRRMMKTAFLGNLEANVSLGPNEELWTVPSLIDNAFSNIVQNAKKEAIGADAFLTTMTREGDELVIRIMDNGIGMNPDQLDPKSSSFVLRGKSGTGSSGSGTKFLDTRLESVQGHLIIMSRKRSNEPQPYATFASDKRSVNSPAEDFMFNTIYEMRLPIRKKEVAGSFGRKQVSK